MVAAVLGLAVAPSAGAQTPHHHHHHLRHAEPAHAEAAAGHRHVGHHPLGHHPVGHAHRHRPKAQARGPAHDRAGETRRHHRRHGHLAAATPHGARRHARLCQKVGSGRNAKVTCR
jgi:hypothetical protein